MSITTAASTIVEPERFLAPQTSVIWIGHQETTTLYALRFRGEVIGLIAMTPPENINFDPRPHYLSKRLSGFILEQRDERCARSLESAAARIVTDRAYFAQKAGEDAAKRQFGSVSDRALAAAEMVKILAEFDALTAELDALQSAAQTDPRDTTSPF